MNMLILTAEQAMTVKGWYNGTDKLDPVPIGDGSYILSVDILTNPVFEKAWPVLEQCTQADYTPPVVTDETM